MSKKVSWSLGAVCPQRRSVLTLKDGFKTCALEIFPQNKIFVTMGRSLSTYQALLTAAHSSIMHGTGYEAPSNIPLLRKRGHTQSKYSTRKESSTTWLTRCESAKWRLLCDNMAKSWWEVGILRMSCLGQQEAHSVCICQCRGTAWCVCMIC